MDVRIRQVATHWDGHVPSARLRVGQCEVDIHRRTVCKADGQVVRLTVKSLHVLLALVEANGQVLSRQELLTRVWPRTLPSDEVLTQAIAQLRRAFRDDRDQVAYIETLARLGYRLLVPVQWLADQPPCADHGDGKLSAHQDVLTPQETLDRPLDALVCAARSGETSGHSYRPASSLGQRCWNRMASAPMLALVGGLGLSALFSSMPHSEVSDVSEREVRAVFSMPDKQHRSSLLADNSQVASFQQNEVSAQPVIRVERTSDGTLLHFSRSADEHGRPNPVLPPDGRNKVLLRLADGSCQEMRVAAENAVFPQAGSCTPKDQAGRDRLSDGGGKVLDESVHPRVAATTPAMVTEGSHPAAAHPVDGNGLVAHPAAGASIDGKRRLVLRVEKEGAALYEIDAMTDQISRLEMPAEGLTLGLYVERGDDVLGGRSLNLGRKRVFVHERCT